MMGVFRLLTATQLVSLVLARPRGLDQNKSHGLRRERLVAIDSIMEERKAEETKMNGWMSEESFTAGGDVQRAAMELSRALSLSMSMDISEVTTDVPVPAPVDEPVDESVVDTQSPAATSPSGPTGPTLPSVPSSSPIAVPVPPSGFPGPSMSPLFVPVPVGTPTTPLDTPSALVPPAPSSSPEETPTALVPPTPSSAPVDTPTQAPDAPVGVPASLPQPEPVTPVIPGGESICLTSNNLVSAADENSTPVSLDFSYSAESNSTIAEFEAGLVEEFIQTAVFAIFGCYPDTTGKIAPNTVEITDASCDPTVDGDNNECYVMQTTVIIGVEGEVDTDVAAYNVYKEIKENMENGSYTDAVPEVVDLDFLSPQPIIPPPSVVDTDGNTPDAIEGTTRSGANVSPWAIGFSVASVMGGFVSLLVWARSRRARQNTSMDETSASWVNPEGEAVI